MSSSINMEELVDAYLGIRAERERIASEYETVDAALKADLGQIEAQMLITCNDLNVNSLRTDHGTVIRSLKERYVTNDWENFRNFVVENNAIDLLERRIHQGNFKTFLAEKGSEGLPPGVNVMREFAVSVRKSNQ